ncbi:MAG: alpha/beta hydrolase [Pseudomonadota bacterium]
MKFADYRKQLAGIGREINPDSIAATRNLLSPLQAASVGADVRVQRDVRYGPDERHRIDVFTPSSGFDPKLPVLIYVHGGGFLAGDKHTEGSPFFTNIGQWAVRNGFNGVTITYRLAPKHQWPSGIEDLRMVIAFIQREGSAVGLGSSSIFLMGQSAGAAHVASYVAHSNLYAPASHGLKGVVLLSGIYDFAAMPPSPMEPAYLGADRSVYPARSSLQGLAQSEVPMLLSVAEYDPPQFEQQTLELLTAVQKAKKHMPPLVYAIGQNHLSVAMYFGLPDDLVAPQVKAFIEEHA